MKPHHNPDFESFSHRRRWILKSSNIVEQWSTEWCGWTATISWVHYASANPISKISRRLHINIQYENEVRDQWSTWEPHTLDQAQRVSFTMIETCMRHANSWSDHIENSEA